MKSTFLTLFVAILLAFLPGCESIGLMPVVEHKASLSAISAAEGHESSEYLEWAATLSKQPNAKPLPDLSAATQEQRDAWFHSRQVRRQELQKVLGQ